MATDMGRGRPLSPHLQIWRWHVTLAASILHRFTGIALYAGAFLLAFWLVSLASGPQAYAAAEGLFLSWFGRLALFGVTAAGAFHIATGVRHLVWDTGRGFKPATADATAWAACFFALLATTALWAAAYFL